MIKIRKLSLLLATTVLLVACTESVEQEPEAQSSVISQSSQELESSLEVVSEEASLESVESESKETFVESYQPVSEEILEESSEETSQPVSEEILEEPSEETTQLNLEEAAMIERGKATIIELTGYSEEGYIFLIHPTEEEVVTIEIREDGEQVASMIGMFRYNDETKEVQEMDIITGKYVDHPAE